MRLATFNVMHGQSLPDGRVEVDRFRDAIARLDADVLALQEVDQGQSRSHGLDLAGEAADVLGARFRFVPTLRGTPGEHWRAAHARDGQEEAREGPRYGIALLSRLPVDRWYVHRMPAAPVPSPLLLPGPERRMRLMQDEPRVVLAARVDTPAGPLTVACTHLSFVPGWNALQLVRTTRRLRELPGPWVLAGDLNLPGSLPRILSGWRQLARSATYPAGQPRVQIDHVLGHGHLPPVTDTHTVATPVSDHLALVVRLDLADHR